MHSKIAEALEELLESGAEIPIEELASQFSESASRGIGFAKKGARYGRLAAEAAVERFAWTDAAQLYSRCYELMASASDDLGEDAAAIDVAMGLCWWHSGELRASWRCLMRAIDAFLARGDGIELARATLAIGRFFAPQERVIQLTEQALESLGDADPYLRARLLVQRTRPGGFAPLDGRDAEAAASAQELAESFGYEDVKAGLWLTELGLARREQRFADSVAAGEAAFRAFDALGDFAQAAEALNGIPVTLLWEGDLVAGEDAERAAIDYATKVHSPFHERRALRELAALAIARCNFDEFEAIVAPASDDYRVALLRMSVAELRGDVESAVAMASDLDLLGLPLHELDWATASRARVLQLAGDELGAREQLARWQQIRDQRFAWKTPNSFAELGDCLVELGSEEQLRSAEEFLSTYGRVRYAPHIGRGLDHVRGRIALRLDRAEEAEDHFRAGLEWARTQNCPIELGRCHEGLADVELRRRKPSDAQLQFDAAVEVFGRHGLVLDSARANDRRGRLPPSPQQEGGHPDGLSTREIQVLRLIAAGRSNRDIAEELVIASGTVARHVSNMLTKTSLSNRTELAAYAVARGLIDS